MEKLNSTISREVDTPIATDKPRFSIATLVTDYDEYQQMLDSFIASGFTTSDCEFIHADNVQNNKLDAYSGLNKFIHAAQSEYIILCHQDVLINFDDRKKLEAKIAEIDTIDPHWAVLGNCGGGRNLSKRFFRISDTHGENRHEGELPQQVNSLDENFILVKKSANIGLSRDMQGYHFYGTDICLQANNRGYHCYVIDFHLTHKSKGTRDKSFYDARTALVKKYAQAWKGRFVRTSCTSLYISGKNRLSKFLNNKFILSRIRKLHRWRHS